MEVRSARGCGSLGEEAGESRHGEELQERPLPEVPERYSALSVGLKEMCHVYNELGAGSVREREGYLLPSSGCGGAVAGSVQYVNEVMGICSEVCKGCGHISREAVVEEVMEPGKLSEVLESCERGAADMDMYLHMS